MNNKERLMITATKLDLNHKSLKAEIQLYNLELNKLLIFSCIILN